MLFALTFAGSGELIASVIWLAWLQHGPPCCRVTTYCGREIPAALCRIAMLLGLLLSTLQCVSIFAWFYSLHMFTLFFFPALSEFTKSLSSTAEIGGMIGPSRSTDCCFQRVWSSIQIDPAVIKTVATNHHLDPERSATQNEMAPLFLVFHVSARTRF